MEKREQRVRRDRKKDARRNPVQRGGEKETIIKNNINQSSAPVDSQETDTKNPEVVAAKSVVKDTVLEDDPLRFANLKRETDEIAALKAKKPQKRQVFSNWWRYEETLPSENESQAVDFETLLHAPQSGSFKFKSEAHWDAGTFGQYGELFLPDAELLVAGLTSIPFYTRLGIDKCVLVEDEIKRMDSCANMNSVAYQKVNKSKQKPKLDAADLFRINYSEEFTVEDKENVSPTQICHDTVASKPQFKLEQSPEPFNRESARSTPDRAMQPIRGGVDTSTKEFVSEATLQDLSSGKMSSPSLFTTSDDCSPFSNRDDTSVKIGTKEMTAQEFDFCKPPTPYQIASSNNVRHPRPSGEDLESVSTSVEVNSHNRSLTPTSSFEDKAARDSHLAKETLSAEASKNNFLSEESTSFPEALPPQKSLLENNIRFQGTENGEGTGNGTAGSGFITPSEMECPTEIQQKEEMHEVHNAKVDEQSVKQEIKRKDRNATREQKSENTACLENYQKKGAKVENREHTSNTKGGGRHGRRKKGQLSSTQEQEQVEVEVEKHPRSEQMENRVEIKQIGTSDAKLSVTGRISSIKPCVMAEEKEKPEGPTPASSVQQQQTTSENGPTATREASPRKSDERASDTSFKKTPSATKQKQSAPMDDEHLNFLMSLKGQKAGVISEIETAKSCGKTTVSRSAIEEDELRESQNPPPVTIAEKKEDLEDWLDSMLDD